MALVAVGVRAVFQQVSGVWDLVVGCVLAAMLFLWWLLACRLSALTTLRFPPFALFGTLTALLALAGFDSLWARWLHPITAIGPSLLAGFGLFWGLAVLALARPFRRPGGYPGGLGPTIASALGLAFLATVAVPAVFAILAVATGDESDLPTAQPPSTLEVIVLHDDTATPPPASQSVGDWLVHTFAGRVTRAGGRDRIAWDNGQPPPVDGSGRTVRVMLLFPDGGTTTDLESLKDRPEIAGEDLGGTSRWLGLARSATDEAVPTYAFLRTTDRDRLDRWHAALASDADAPFGDAPFGDAVGLDAIGSADTSTDLALRYGVQRPSAAQDLALAISHRPALYFDTKERPARPLDVDAIFASGVMRQCTPVDPDQDHCPVVRRAADLKDADHSFLAFDPAAATAASEKSVIYAHVTHAGNDAPDAIYLDYWWYLPDNPNGAVGGALCGAGFTIAGRTCHDHQSDWEGMTVVLDGANPDGPPLKVIYAQHDGTVSYSWPAAQLQWEDEDVPTAGVDTAKRPLAFVALGSHASYAMSCLRAFCPIVDARGQPAASGSTEKRHDGKRAWQEGNADDRCNGQCVRLLPTTADDRPALWNAYDGPWGSQSCILRVICTRSEPPRSPGRQKGLRYRQPWHAGHSYAVADDGAVVAAKASCTGRRATAGERSGANTLLALGDSFSSGQGGGEYECGTTTAGANTCYRSPAAWPNVLAAKMQLVALPSLACSSAVSAEVHLDGKSHNGEAERNLRQVGRITGYPKIITLTIGGNDVGFSDILKTCLGVNGRGDCYDFYHRNRTDALAQEVRRVAPDLADTYAAIRHKAPQSRLVVSGYPRLFARGVPDLQPIGGCLNLVTIKGREATYLNAMVGRLNAAIEAAAKDAGATYVDVEDALDGHEVGCDPHRRWIHPPDLQRELFPASFHPTDAGYRRLAAVIRPQLARPAAP